MVLPFLTEGIRQSGHSSVAHSDRQVLPFNVRSANLFRVRIAAARNLLSASYFTGGILALVCFGCVVLNELSEVYI